MQRIANQLLIVISVFLAAAINAQTITPIQTDEIIIDNGASGKADPGDRIRYKVTIQNTGSQAGNNTQLNIVPDPRTSFVPGSFRSSPLALPDAYACTGNVGISVPAASGVKTNDFDDNTAGLTVTAGTFASTQGGSVMMAADGSFMYTPPAGFIGTDTYTYTLNDGNAVSGVPATDVGTVTITVSNMIWFVDNSAAAGDGRLGTPFNSLAAVNGPAAINQVIFVKYTGANYGNITLKNGQYLFGTGHSGGSNLADSGVLPFALAPNSKALPAINGSHPFLTSNSTGGILLASGNTIRGVDAGTTAAGEYAIRDNGSSVGTLTINDASINNTLGAFRAASGGALNVTFGSITATSGGSVNGIFLSNASGTFVGGTGTIGNMTGTPILISGGTVALDYNGALSKTSAGRVVDIQSHATGTISLDGNITCNGATTTGILLNGNTSGSISFNGSSKNFSTAANSAVTLSNNTGTTIQFSGGGLTIVTTTAIGLTATGGGTVTVTGSGNTISSESATALNVVSTNIGAANLNFTSITSGNNTAAPEPVNGIVLNTTGSSGGLVITGNGGAANDGSGGTIQRCSGVGILISSSSMVSIARMNISDNLGEGLTATSVNGLAMLRCNVQNNGDLIFSGGAEGAGEANIEFYQLSGTCTITSCLIEGGRENNIFLSNSGSTTLNISLLQSTLRNTPITSNQGSGCRWMLYGNTNTTISITQNTFHNHFGQHAEIYLRQNAVADVDILNNNCTATSTSLASSFSINCIGDVTLAQTFEGSLTYDISGNNIQGAIITAIAVNLSPLYFNPVTMTFFQGGGDASGQITNNIIGTAATANSGSFGGSGIGLDSRGNAGSTHTCLIRNNQIHQYNNHGISLTVGETNSASSVNLTIQGNTIKNPGSFGQHGIMINSGTVSSSADQVCLNIGGTGAQENDIVGAGSVPNSGMDFRIRQRQSTTIFLPGYAGANTDLAAMIAYIQGRNTGTPTGSGAVNAPPGGGFQNTAGGVPCVVP